jgi:hypothetical protein
MPADAGGEVGRTNAVARFPEEVLLGDPVLERMKRCDRKAAARPQHGHGCDQTLLKVRELVVDRDPQRLEHTRRGIDAARSLRFHAEDDAAEVIGGEERLARTPAHDGGGDATGLGLLAVAREDVAQVFLLPAVHDVGRRSFEPRVRAHVQGSCRAEAEATRRIGELNGREAEIEKDTVDLVEAAFAGHDVEKREVALCEYGALSEPGKDAPRLCERCGIDIETEEAAGRRGAVEDRFGMSSPTDRAIEEAATFAGIKLGEYFGQENRLMQPPS